MTINKKGISQATDKRKLGISKCSFERGAERKILNMTFRGLSIVI
jgi:hypothetical protein